MKSIFKMMEHIAEDTYDMVKHSAKDMAKAGSISRDVYKAVKHEARDEKKMLKHLTKDAGKLFKELFD